MASGGRCNAPWRAPILAVVGYILEMAAKPHKQLHHLAAVVALLAIGLFPLTAHAVQDCSINGVPVNPNDGNTTAGKSGIMRCVERDTGQLVREQELRQGTFMGLERFYRSGRLEREFTVNERGNKDGRSRELGPEGQVLRDENYRNGDLDGLAYRYADGARLVRVSFHEPGRGERAVAEFNAAGQLTDLRCADKPLLVPAVDDKKLCGFGGSSITPLYTGRQTLRARITFEAGQAVRQEFVYDNGQPERVVQRSSGLRIEQKFSATGTKQAEDHFAESGKGWQAVLEQRFSDLGRLVHEKKWDATGMLTERRFYLNGQPEHVLVETQQDGKRERLRTDYHDNGVVSHTGRYTLPSRYRDLPTGVHQHFDEKGRVRSELHYDDKGHVARERMWDDKGVLTRDEEVFADGSRKAFTK